MIETSEERQRDLLPDNPIGPIWHVCFVANSFVFPIYARFEKEHGITRMEFVVLFVLAQRRNTTSSDIVRMTGLPKNNVSRGVNRLLDKGLLVRVEDEQDRRRSILSLTQEGERLFGVLVAQYKERGDRFLATLTARERNMLACGIGALAANIVGHEAS